LLEAFEGLVELTVETGFEAGEAFEGAGFFGKFTVGHGGADGDFELFEGGVAELFVLVVDGGDFEAGHALHAPAGGGHDVDEGLFSGGLGFVFLIEAGDEDDEAFGVFGTEDGAGGEDLVAAGVLGADRFAEGGPGTSGAEGVEAVRGDLFFGGHLGWVLGESFRFDGGRRCGGGGGDVVAFWRDIYFGAVGLGFLGGTESG
jgi:hypothetical protein